MSRITFLGVHIDNLSMTETLSRIATMIESKKTHRHVVVNASKIVQAKHDPVVMDAINSCDLINVDGMAVVWAARLLRVPVKERVAGIDLFYALLQKGHEHAWRIYFLGAQEDVVQSVVAIVLESYPNVVVAGSRNGYWADEDEESVVEDIRQAKPDILFVGISSPRKERFLYTHVSKMGVPFAMGVGGSFDVFAGKIKRAPVWMQKSGLEWAFRVMQEPQRMFWRYLSTNTLFVGYVMRAFFLKIFRLRDT